MSKNPTLEEFLAQALPKDADKPHALAVGEHHDQVENLRYFTQQLDTLKAQNNLGAIGLEKPPFMEVILWAYADGVVDEAYVKRMFQAYGEAEYSEAMKEKAGLAIEAIKRDIPLFCFDTRDTFAQFAAQKGALEAYREELSKDPDLRDKLINEEDASFINRSQRVQVGFLISEIRALLKDKEHPEYRARLNDLEAVLLAQRTMRGESKLLGYDAVGAALIAERTPQGKNALTISGLDHIMGLASRKDGVEGTLAQHLNTNFEATTALAGNSKEVRKVLLDYVRNPIFTHPHNAHPFHLPNIMLVDEDRVITEIPESAESDTIEEILIDDQASYYIDNPLLKDAPFPMDANIAEVRKSTRYMSESHIQTALGKLHRNEPWAELIAKGRGAEQDAERG
ncbi:MAG: hypothetical protein J0M34_03265 [Alphaproteobacteria bacterium]|nr:hypothetical protein [Alphaproteobacteria bacterium]